MEPRENAVSDTRDLSWDSKAGTGRVDFGTTGPPHQACTRQRPVPTGRNPYSNSYYV